MGTFQGPSSRGLSHIDCYGGISLTQVLNKPDVELLPLLHSSPLTKVSAWNLPRSGNLAKLIPDEKHKMKYLVSEMGLCHSVVETLKDKDLIVGPKFRTALFYCPDNGPCRAMKIFDHQSISEISKNKVKDLGSRSVKTFGVLPLNKVYAKNNQGLQKGHMIGAKLFAENKDSFWFSCNYLNVVPMYRTFNYPFFHHNVERPFLKFAQEVTRAGDSVCLIVSVSPNTRYDEQTRQCIPTRYRYWLRNNGWKINIPRLVSFIAFSLSERGGVREVFAFVGNNDDSSPKYYFPQNLSDLQNCYSRDGDPTSKLIISHLKSAGYKMWPDHAIHRRIPRPIDRSTVDRLPVDYQRQQQQIDGTILPPIYRLTDDRLSVAYQRQQQQIDGPILPSIHRSTVDRRSVNYQQQQQQIDWQIHPPTHGRLSTAFRSTINKNNNK